MFSQLPMYQLQGASAYKKDLTNTVLLLNHLDNAKNYNAYMLLEQMVKDHGTHACLYSARSRIQSRTIYFSHLKDFRERIKINGEDISQEFVCDFINTNKPFFEANDISFLR
jgi:dihydrofolate synthase/folylpolyglutamate synthase